MALQSGGRAVACPTSADRPRQTESASLPWRLPIQRRRETLRHADRRVPARCAKGDRLRVGTRLVIGPGTHQDDIAGCRIVIAVANRDIRQITGAKLE